MNTAGTIVRTDDEHLVVTLGLKDCIVVHTPNATLVASKHDEEQIRQVVKELESRGWRRLSVTSNRITRVAGIDFGTVRIGIATADLAVGIAARSELHTAVAAARREVLRGACHAGEDRAVRGRAAGPI